MLVLRITLVFNVRNYILGKNCLNNNFIEMEKSVFVDNIMLIQDYLLLSAIAAMMIIIAIIMAAISTGV